MHPEILLKSLIFLLAYIYMELFYATAFLGVEPTSTYHSVCTYMATLPQPQTFRAWKSHFRVFTFALISYPVDETFSNLTWRLFSNLAVFDLRQSKSEIPRLYAIFQLKLLVDKQSLSWKIAYNLGISDFDCFKSNTPKLLNNLHVKFENVSSTG